MNIYLNALFANDNATFDAINVFPSPDKEDVTKYAAEDWHIRYVGVKTATLIHNKGITFDEYWIKYVKKDN